MNDVIPPLFKLIQEFWIPQEKTKHENLFPQNYISFVSVMEGHKVISFTIVKCCCQSSSIELIFLQIVIKYMYIAHL